jgi:opacity protein-like surface antigen
MRLTGADAPRKDGYGSPVSTQLRSLSPGRNLEGFSMRLRILAVCLALALVPAIAAAGSVGIGAFGGLSVPVLTNPGSQGPQFGVRVPINVLPLLTFEPFYAQSALGDQDETFAGQSYTRSGPELYTYGVNAAFKFGEGVKFYPLVGIGSTKIEQSGADDITETSLNFGLGFGFSPMPRLDLDLRGELSSVITGDTSRKYGNFTVGVSYALFDF